MGKQQVFDFFHDMKGLPVRAAEVFSYLLEAAVFGGLLILLLMVVRRFFRRQLGSRAIWTAWLLIAVRLLVPLALPNPVMDALRPAQSTVVAARPVADQVRVRLTDAALDLSQALSVPKSPAATDTVTGQDYGVAELLSDMADYTERGWTGKWFLYLYVAGAAIVALWMLVRNAIFGRRMRNSRVALLSGELLETYHDLCRAQHRHPLPVYWADPLPCACIVGAIRPYIALPLSMPPDQAKMALLHELAHDRGHDTWWAMLRNVCCVVQWFNPLVWIGAKLSRQDCELACDERVIQAMDTEERRAYAAVLVTSAARRTSPGVVVVATGMTMTGKRLKQRLSAILESRAVRRGALVSFAALGCAALIAAFATAETTPAQAPEPDVSPNDVSAPSTFDATDTLHRPVTTEAEAVALAIKYARHPLLSGEEGCFSDNELDWCVFHEEETWYVFLTSWTQERFFWQLGDDGRLRYYWRGYIMAQPETTSITAEQDVAAAVFQEAGRVFLGAESVENVTLLHQTNDEGNVCATASAQVDGVRCTMALRLWDHAVTFFSTEEAEKSAVQNQLTVLSLMADTLRKEMGVERQQVSAVLSRVVWDSDHRRLIGVISAQPTWMSQEAARRFAQTYGPRERYTMHLAVSPGGSGADSLEIVSSPQEGEGKAALTTGTTPITLTTYEIIDGRYLVQAGGVPAGTAYEALDSIHPQEAGLIPSGGSFNLGELTLIRYLHPSYQEERTQWVATDSLWSAKEAEGTALQVTVQDEAYAVQAIPIESTEGNAPPDDALPLRDALAVALQTVSERYGLTVQELTAYPARYVYIAESPAHWRVILLDPLVLNYDYELSIASPSGEILDLSGPQDGNG